MRWVARPKRSADRVAQATRSSLFAAALLELSAKNGGFLLLPQPGPTSLGRATHFLHASRMTSQFPSPPQRFADRAALRKTQFTAFRHSARQARGAHTGVGRLHLLRQEHR